MAVATPEIGQLVKARGQHWVVTDVRDGARTIVDLQSVADGGYGRELRVIWEVEPGRAVLESETLPDVAQGRFDDPERLAAFLDALRWGAVTSADTSRLQAPFRSGVATEDYQLDPVARALRAPRVNLLIADDVGLGKTIEAGLVAQELLLRGRAHRVMIVCPAGLTVKWRDEMAEKFGLDFVTVDAARLKELRRTHGLAANPFRVYPRTIVSLPWLRGQRAQRLLDEVLPAEGPAHPRGFDLLIVDEAHHVAPAAPSKAYAVDSQQTRVLRRLADHFEHRLFLTATPHNGYTESFTALLEMIDPQRFARGVTPDPATQGEVVVRRLKDQVTDADGHAKFPGRETAPIPVDYPEAEREVHDRLTEYAELRRKRLGDSKAGMRAADLVTLLLKKRLFSSPAAFGQTVAVHLESMRARARDQRPRPAPTDVPGWLEDWFDDDTLDDDALAESETDALTRSARLQPPPTQEEIELLERMERWAATHEARPDVKAQALLGYIEAVCRPDGRHWTNERIVVFTEYRDTQRWLAGLLEQAGLGGERLTLLHGGTDPDERELLRKAFQADPAEHPVRVLLATDAASEGIDLQRHCHRLVNYDIPFNPNKLEQRIGRLDRYGQREPVDVRHFVGVGWDRARPGSYEADLEFLSRVATKVARMEEDLGAVNTVLSTAVQDRMLGRLPADFDVERATDAPSRGRGRKPRSKALAAERDVRERVTRLRAQLDESIAALHLAPPNVERVVRTGLELAHQQPLRPVLDERELAEGLFEVPTLTGSWVRATEGLVDELTGEQRPVTFDSEVAAGRDDVVLAHLGHPLTAMSTRLLRAAMWGGSDLHRATAVVSDDERLETTLVAADARLVLVGRDGARLHEEIVHAGGWLHEGRRFARVESVQFLADVLDRALDREGVQPAAEVVGGRLAQAWPYVRSGLRSAVGARARTRADSLHHALDQRRDEEVKRITERLDRFAASLRSALDTDSGDDGQLELPLKELEQRKRDRHTWEKRLAQLEEEKEREVAAIHDRYRVVDQHVFPAAVIFVVPTWEATR